MFYKVFVLVGERASKGFIMITTGLRVERDRGKNV